MEYGIPKKSKVKSQKSKILYLAFCIQYSKKLLYQCWKPLQHDASLGFTLVEMMVVMAIFGIIVAIGSSVFVNVLRSNTKASLLSQIREDGNRAIESMSRSFQNAAKIVDPSGSIPACPAYIIVQNKQQSQGTGTNATYTRFSIFSYSSGTNNGFIAINSSNDLATLQAITAGNATAITNKSGTTALDVDSSVPACLYVVKSADGSVTIVNPVFTLKQSKAVVLGRKENEAKVPFQTTFSLRVY